MWRNGLRRQCHVKDGECRSEHPSGDAELGQPISKGNLKKAKDWNVFTHTNTHTHTFLK